MTEYLENGEKAWIKSMCIAGFFKIKQQCFDDRCWSHLTPFLDWVDQSLRQQSWAKSFYFRQCHPFLKVSWGLSRSSRNEKPWAYWAIGRFQCRSDKPLGCPKVLQRLHLEGGGNNPTLYLGQCKRLEPSRRTAKTVVMLSSLSVSIQPISGPSCFPCTFLCFSTDLVGFSDKVLEIQRRKRRMKSVRRGMIFWRQSISFATLLQIDEIL